MPRNCCSGLNQVLAEVTGDDRSEKLLYDGKSFVAFSAQKKEYARISVPEGTTIDAGVMQ